MTDLLPEALTHFALLDALAVFALILAWLGSTAFIERKNTTNPSTHMLMEQYRERWMTQMVTRQPRIFDSSVLAIMRQGSTFFASSCMIAIGGCVALLGGADQLTMFASDLASTPVAPKAVWEVKILLLMALLANGFLKFVWSVRLFGYCAIVMASTPNDPTDDAAYPTAAKSAEIANHAARSFNRGKRSVYFTIAALTWLIGAIPLIIATLVTLTLIYRREFNSRTRLALAN
ncbi:DUF599 domain-containing protein [Amylibacter sp. IMCC11727]|uniref:DUF599 domain-containing protein n=1 Tax=Amylibacter sp. IMCC11727 TaxID=3039851 RepID=UPI00244DFF53|nr:DUF599 domain-containing protein [Amylibacter sp. IMCC11727]WGI21313.1 DUF599 domain-containing protein [Amylibacter sp. IMCC11727]